MLGGVYTSCTFLTWMVGSGSHPWDAWISVILWIRCSVVAALAIWTDKKDKSYVCPSQYPFLTHGVLHHLFQYCNVGGATAEVRNCRYLGCTIQCQCAPAIGWQQSLIKVPQYSQFWGYVALCGCSCFKLPEKKDTSDVCAVYKDCPLSGSVVY